MDWSPFKASAPALCAALCGCNLVVQTISEYGGEPIAGIRIQVNDGQWVETDAEGRAELPASWGSYTLRVAQRSELVNPVGGRHYVSWDLLELDSPPGNPVVLQVEGTYVPHRFMTISGTVRGASGGHVALQLAGPGVVQLGSTTARADGTFEFETVQWEGADGRAATVHAIEDDGAPFPAMGFLAYGSAPVTLTDSGSASVDVELHPVESPAVRADVSLPPGFNGETFGAVAVRLPGGWLGVGGGAVPAPGAFDVHVPRLPGVDAASLSVTGAGAAGGFTGQVRPVNAVVGAAFDLPASVELLEPAEGATAGAGTVFRWSAHPSGGPYDLYFRCHWSTNEEEGDVSYRELETTLTERALPAIPDVSIEPGAICSWDVTWADADARTFSVVRPDPKGRSSTSALRLVTFQ